MALNAGSIISYMVLNTDKFSKGIKDAKSDVEVFTKTTGGMGDKLSAAGTMFTNVGKKATKGLTIPLVGVGSAVTLLGMDFESSMSQVRAISGATESDFVKLEAKAREMGATTKFSASDSAEALNYMAMAGWDTHQMLDGIDGVMNLAAASGEDLATVSDIVTDALTGFGMEASQSGEFADLLASASANANTNVGMMGETFKYVAPLFGSLGYSAEDAALATGLLANAGIKGSQAGTVLRGAVSRLVKPTGEAAKLIKDLGISTTDANGNMLPFKDILDQLRGTFGELTDEQQAQYAATIFGQEAMTGMLAIINASDEDYDKLTEATRNYTGAAGDMADVMEDNLKGELTVLKSQLEEVGLQIYEILLPILRDFVERIQDLVSWFSSLDDSTKETIVKIGMFVAAIGPALIVIGKVSTGVGALTKLFGGLGGAAAKAGGAKGIGLLAGGMSKAGLAAKAGAVLLNPWTLGIAAAGVAGYGLYKHLSQEAIPEVERFGDAVSESTQEAVGGFMDLTEEANIQLKELAWGQQEVTAEMAEDMRTKQQTITDTLLNAISERNEQEVETAMSHMGNLEALDEEHQAAIIERMNERYEAQAQKAEEGHARINEIIALAEAEGREITKAESDEILRIRESMTEQAVAIMSENELEQKVILEKMKDNASTISAQEAAEVVRNSKAKKDDVIAEAEEQFDETYKWAVQQRDELGLLSDEEAQEIIDAAREKRDETIKNAEEMHDNIVSEAQQQADEHVNLVDWETGEVKSKWDVMKENVTTKAKDLKDDVVSSVKDWGRDFKSEVEDMKSKASTAFGNLQTSVSGAFDTIKTKIGDGISKLKEWNDTKVKNKVATFTQKVKTVGDKILSGLGIGKNALGTTSWRGGLTWVGEQGPELIDLPTSTRVYSNQQSMKQVAASANGFTGNISLDLSIPLDGREIAKSTVTFTAEELAKMKDRKR